MRQQWVICDGNDELIARLTCTVDELEHFIGWARRRVPDDLRVYGTESDGLPVLLFPNDRKGAHRGHQT